MNEYQTFEMEEKDSNLGKVEISPEVIEVISSLAATEVEGVSSMRGNFASGVVERFGKKSLGKGVKVELSEDGINIDVFVTMNFGVSIPDTAEKIQENIRHTLYTMTALEPNRVDVHVVGVQFEDKLNQPEEIEEF
ncbi:Asp23/Gls24 family envelope stress response protein [Pseudalkalibacillus berkeleyi]|uniref:Asp23/Gls24 family envelope stress response protein n=1 Tax=Pseudalkalibacillus berkeleyi TaxID=1069813 RepID=A0ABS9GYK8_9BACL|nr:Asp23/Gls24 family envelope stress response protein [Pseudalkalibacillus berkeleyi]MCF6137852.1 Asp23/Gls24 family envelope stress response protein [Pseudalkalibacillus berkeleyi]